MATSKQSAGASAAARARRVVCHLVGQALLLQNEAWVASRCGCVNTGSCCAAAQVLRGNHDWLLEVHDDMLFPATWFVPLLKADGPRVSCEERKKERLQQLLLGEGSLITRRHANGTLHSLG